MSKQDQINLEDIVKRNTEPLMEERKKGGNAVGGHHTKPNESILALTLFSLAGTLSIYPEFVMLAQSGIMEELFPSQEYSFLVLIPLYTSIPPAMIVTKLLSKTPFSILTKLITSLLLSCSIFLFVPFFGIREKYNEGSEDLMDTKSNFYCILLSFFLMYLFCLIYQSYFTAIMAAYNPAYTRYYFTFQALSNIIIMAEKSLSYSFSFSVEQDFALIWGTYTVLIFLSIYLVLKLSRTEEYKVIKTLNKSKERESPQRKLNAPRVSTEILINELETGHKDDFDYFKAWKIIKWDALGIFFTMSLCFSVFPGVIFNSPPATLFTLKGYILVINIISAVFDILFRPLATKPYAKAIVYSSFVLAVFIVCFFVYNFLTEFQRENEGVVYLIFVLIAFLIFRNSISVTYFMVSSSKKELGDHGEGVASIMTNALHIGLAFGNILSNMFLVVKEVYFDGA